MTFHLLIYGGSLIQNGRTFTSLHLRQLLMLCLGKLHEIGSLGLLRHDAKAVLFDTKRGN